MAQSLFTDALVAAAMYVLLVALTLVFVRGARS